MTYLLTPEQKSLLNAAFTSWRRRGAAKRQKLSFSEESITETVLQDLAVTFPSGCISIVSFNKRQEGKTGADWAWTFLSSDGATNLPMLVQAKVLDLQDFEYPEIKRTMGRAKPPIRQIDQLIQSAENLGWPAIYAFYNHLDDPTRIPNVCPTLLGAYQHLPEAWGISIADAHRVRSKLDDQTFDAHRQHSIALHCLLCSRGAGRLPSGSPKAILDSLKRLREIDSDPSVPGYLHFEDSLPDAPFKELPEIFRMAQTLAKSETGVQRELILNNISEKYPGIAGAVILQDSG